MALVNRSILLDITPGAIPQIVNVSEYDQNRAYTVTLVDEGGVFEIPSGTTATIEGTIKDSPFSESATVSGNTITFTLSENMTAKAGDVWCKIKLTKDSKPIQTAAFILRCDRAGVEADTIINAPGFKEQIAEAAEAWLEKQGFSSPTVTVADIEGGHRVTFTDVEHPQGQSIDVMDGKDGDFILPEGGEKGQALVSDGENGAEWGEAQSDSLVLRSPDGTKWMVAVTNSGEIISERAPYTITRTLNNCVGKTVVQDYEEGTALLEVYEADDYYTLDGATVSVTMGGVDVTSDVYNDRVVTIPDVTGDVVITVDAVAIEYHTATEEELTFQLFEGNLFIKSYTGTYENVKLPTSVVYNGTTYSVANGKLYLYSMNFGTTIVHFGNYGEIPVFRNTGNSYPTGSNVKSISPNPSAGRSKNLANLQKLFKGSATTTWTASDSQTWNGNAAFKTALGVVYPEAQTSLTWLYVNCTGLIDGGTIPSWVTNVKNTFYGCTSLKHVRIEAKNTTDVSGWLYNVPASCVVELYTDSNLYTSLKNALSAYEHRYKGIDAEIKRIYCVGDSITYGSGATSPNTESYPVVLSKTLTQTVLVGRGAQGGYTMKQILDTFITPYPQRCKEDIVIMMAGTNGVGESGKTKIQMWAEMVAALDGNPHFIVIPETTSGYNAAFEEQLAEIYGDNFLAVHDWFVDNGYTMSEYLTDGTHFNTAGYALLAQCVKEKLNALGWLD